MMNAFDQPQTILVLGGRSEIAHAIVRELASPSLTTVVLAHRGGNDVAIDGLPEGAKVVSGPFDATDHASHAAFVESMAKDHGDLDIVIQAFGQLGGDTVNTDPTAAGDLVDVNVLTNDAWDKRSGTSEFKAAAIRIDKLATVGD